MNARRWRCTALVAALATAAAVGPGATAGEPSAEYQASLKRTLELRKQRRGAARARVGVIEPYPMPPTLIIRHTRETHEEIDALLNLLRYGSH